MLTDVLDEAVGRGVGVRGGGVGGAGGICFSCQFFLEFLF